MEYVGKLIESDGQYFMAFETSDVINVEEIRRFNTNGEFKATIKFDDERSLSADQRKKAHALLGDIARWSGDDPEYIKAWLKYYFIADTGAEYFSLSDTDMTTARLFINYLIEFAFKWDIPFKDKGLTLQDDIGKYLWLCLKYRKCAICGKHADVHHIDTVGAGRNRGKVNHSELEMIALCRTHHNEAHQIGWHTFNKKYQVAGIKLTVQDIKEFKIG